MTETAPNPSSEGKALGMTDEERYFTREIESFDRTIVIKQDLSGELGATVWDAGLVLAKYFENTTTFPVGHFKGKRVLELGAGTGVVGIILAALGAKVLLTDRSHLLPLLRENIQTNKCERRAKAETLEWGSDISSLSPPFDYVIASDVVAGCYSEDFPKLVKTLSDVSDRDTKILLSYEMRGKKDLEFFQLLKEGFEYKKIPNSQLDPHWQSEDIGIFIVRKK